MTGLDRWIWRGIDAAALNLSNHVSTQGDLSIDSARMAIRAALIESLAADVRERPKPAARPEPVADGGPAFPREGVTPASDTQVGMSLRDFLAGQAAAGSSIMTTGGCWVVPDGVAARAYAVADAMIATRGAK